MNNKDASILFTENTLRIESVIHIASMITDYAVSDVVRNAFEDDWDKLSALLGLNNVEPTSDYEELLELLIDKNKMGFLIQVATPIPDKFAEGSSSFTVSWGMYTTQWFYTETFDDVFEQSVAWRDEFIAHRRSISKL